MHISGMPTVSAMSIYTRRGVDWQVSVGDHVCVLFGYDTAEVTYEAVH